jgi:hypothetical protein
VEASHRSGGAASPDPGEAARSVDELLRNHLLRVMTDPDQREGGHGQATGRRMKATAETAEEDRARA